MFEAEIPITKWTSMFEQFFEVFFLNKIAINQKILPDHNIMQLHEKEHQNTLNQVQKYTI